MHMDREPMQKKLSKLKSVLSDRYWWPAVVEFMAREPLFPTPNRFQDLCRERSAISNNCSIKQGIRVFTQQERGAELHCT